MCSTCVTSKECKECGFVKPLEDFCKVKAGKFGRNARCKECMNKSAKKKRFDCLCDTPECGKSFKAAKKNAKFCPDCRPRKKTKEELESPVKKCNGCKEIKDKKEFFKNSGSVDGFETKCKDCVKARNRARTYDLICENPECRKPFKGASKYNKCCPDCRNHIRTQEMIDAGIKRCPTCEEIKDENQFSKSTYNKDGFSSTCKECVREWQQNREVLITCENPECGVVFSSKWKEVRYCWDCRPQRVTQDQLNRKVRLCSCCKDEKHEERFPRSATTVHGRSLRCKDCNNKKNKERRTLRTCIKTNCDNVFKAIGSSVVCPDCQPVRYTYEECEIEANKYEYLIDFVNNSHGHWSKCCRERWVELYDHLIKGGRPRGYTYEECYEEGKKYNSRKEYSDGSGGHYARMEKMGWRDEICQALYGDRDYWGLTRSGFKKSCEAKFKAGTGNGLGLLYLLRCYLNGEVFYKIGITSLGSVKARYQHDGSSTSRDMPYNYEILWTEERDPEEIFDMELWYKRQIKDIRHHPTLWRVATSSESFKCVEDDALLAKPTWKMQLSEKSETVKHGVL